MGQNVGPQGAPGPGARRGPKRVSTQRGRPGARAARAPAPPRGPPNGGENVSKTRARRRRAVRRPGARMRLLDGRGWRPLMTAGELKVPRRSREELAAGRGQNPPPEASRGPGNGATGVAAGGATEVAAARARTRSAARAFQRPSRQARPRTAPRGAAGGAAEDGAEPPRDRGQDKVRGRTVREEVSAGGQEPARAHAKAARRTRPEGLEPRRLEGPAGPDAAEPSRPRQLRSRRGKIFPGAGTGNISEVAAWKAVSKGPQGAPVKGGPETRAGRGPEGA